MTTTHNSVALPPGYRLIASNPRYCIDINMNVLDLKTGLPRPHKFETYRARTTPYVALYAGNRKSVHTFLLPLVAALFRDELIEAVSLPNERWKSCVEQGYSQYLISTEGRTFSLSRGRVLTPRKNNRGGYWQVNMTDDERRKRLPLVSRLVCHAFNGAPTDPTMHADHIYGNVDDNRAVSLRWLTPEENQASPIRQARRAAYYGKPCRHQLQSRTKMSDNLHAH